MMKQFEVLQWAFSFLKKHGREEKVAEILLEHYTNQASAAFYANMREEIPTDVWEQFSDSINQHVETGIPVQHLLGFAHFYGREFTVNDDVLIPRFETEELVQYVIEQVQNRSADEPLTIVDVGTGSGVIAITLALELPQATVYATDISEQALAVATQNAKQHHAEVAFFEGNFLEPIIEGRVNPDIIVSNPPYIDRSTREKLADTVKDFDPDLALFAENHGLAAYETIMEQLIALPAMKGRFVAFEIGYDQAAEVTNVVKKHYPLSKVTVKKDMNEKDRIISFYI